MSLPVIVAIPARNEARHISACLRAVAAQPGADRKIAAAVLFANNCSDETVDAARATPLPFSLDIVAANLPPGNSHIGYARRGASDAALARMTALGIGDAIIAGTDADSRVSSGWLAALLKEFDAGVGAVCGAIDLDGSLAPGLSEKLETEAQYAHVVARAIHLLDPLGHDPWPNHIWCWGANFAVRARIIAAVGGPPLVDLAEDRALHAELLRRDVPIRHSPTTRVFTSARPVGRAPGGLADLMRLYTEDPEAMADYFLEPAGKVVRRARLRGEARRAWGQTGGFGAYWTERESNDPDLMREQVAVANLPLETTKLSQYLNAEAHQSCNPHAVVAPAMLRRRRGPQ